MWVAAGAATAGRAAVAGGGAAAGAVAAVAGVKRIRRRAVAAARTASVSVDAKSCPQPEPVPPLHRQGGRRTCDGVCMDEHEHWPVGVARLDDEGRITYANRRLCEWFRILPPGPAGEQTGEPCIACGEQCRAFCLSLRAHARAGNRSPFRRSLLVDEGVALECRCARLLDDSGWLAIVEDVSARHQDDLIGIVVRQLVEEAPDVIGIARADRTLRWVNRATRQLFGLAPDQDISAYRIDDFQPSIGGRDVADAVALARAQPVIFPPSAVVPPGSDQPVAWVSQMVMSHRDPLDGAVYVSTICRDVTALRDAEQQLDATNRELAGLLAERSRELTYNREFLRSLIEANRDLILSVDVNGDVTFANSGFVGAAAGRLIGTGLASLVDDMSRAEFSGRYREVLTGRSEHALFEAPGAGALQDRWCLFSIGPVRSAGRIAGLTVIVSDLTSLKDAWERVRGSEKLVATGRMAARIAHEINNPLTGISGAIQLIRSDLPAGAPALRYAEMVDREITRVSNIVRQMYGLYRPEQEASRVLDLRPVLDEVVTLMQPDALRRRIRLASVVVASEPALVQEQNLRQILMNIVRNAIEVTAPEGLVELSVERHGRCVDVVVDDQGPGITPELQQQMFEPFYTTKSTSGGRGLGLGLSVSDSLVRAMGGTIQFENRPGGGARCRICLPEAGGA